MAWSLLLFWRWNHHCRCGLAIIRSVTEIHFAGAAKHDVRVRVMKVNKMKKFKQTELSEKRCVTCGNRLKKNLVAKRPNANKCWKDFYPAEMARRNIGTKRHLSV
jgi:hypothetical protein